MRVSYKFNDVKKLHKVYLEQLFKWIDTNFYQSIKIEFPMNNTDEDEVSFKKAFILDFIRNHKLDRILEETFNREHFNNKHEDEVANEAIDEMVVNLGVERVDIAGVSYELYLQIYTHYADEDGKHLNAQVISFNALITHDGTDYKVYKSEIVENGLLDLENERKQKYNSIDELVFHFRYDEEAEGTKEVTEQ